MKANLSGALGNGRLRIVAAVGPLFAGVQFSLTTYLALYYKEVVLVPLVPDERARIVAAGGCLAVAHLGSALARIGWGVVGDRVFPGNRMRLLAVAGVLAAIAPASMIALQAGASVVLALAVAFLAGAMMMGNQGLYTLVAAETAGPRYAGTGVGLCMTGTQLGFVGAPTLFGFILDVAGAYAPAWLTLSVMASAAALVTALLSQQASQTSPAPVHD